MRNRCIFISLFKVNILPFIFIIDFLKWHLEFGNYTNMFIWEWQKQSRLYSQINCLNFIRVFLFRLDISIYSNRSNLFLFSFILFHKSLMCCFLSICKACQTYVLRVQIWVWSLQLPPVLLLCPFIWGSQLNRLRVRAPFQEGLSQSQ